MNKVYIIKSLAPWMMDELKAFAQLTEFKIYFLRKQDKFYRSDINDLINKGIKVVEAPSSYNNLLFKFWIIFNFIIKNLSKFDFYYSGVVGLKSILWFLKLDVSYFSENSSLHAQFATQASLVSILVKKYYNDMPEFSFTFHAHDIFFNNRWLSLMLKNCRLAFSISKFNIDYVNNNYIRSDNIVLSRLGVLRNNISIDDYSKTNQEFKIGFLSWFVEKKGIIYLLEAYHKLIYAGYSEIKLILAGDGPLLKSIKTYIEEPEIKNNIRLIGKVKGAEKEKFFRNLDLFILPSISLSNDQDGIPVVLMEAISYGLPIVSTRVSGIPEICIHNYNGLLINERNPQEIYESIITLYENESLRKKFSKNSLNKSKEYDILLNSKNKTELLKW